MIPLRRRDDQEARKALKKSNRSVFHEWSPLSLPSSRVDARAMRLPGNSCKFGPNNSSRIPPSPSPHLHLHWFPLGEGSQKSSPVQLLSTADLRLRVSPGDECQEASCCVLATSYDKRHLRRPAKKDVREIPTSPSLEGNKKCKLPVKGVGWGPRFDKM